MIFKETNIFGMYQIDPERRGDDRGFFARVFCKNEYEKLGLTNNLAQINMTSSKDAGTFRGMHYQLPPKAEDKIVMCTNGSYLDITLDLRPNSPTYKDYLAMELNNRDRTMLYIPKGCAHGYLILENNTDVMYFVTEFYSPENEKVIRWNDPAFKIKLPYQPKFVSAKDTTAPDFKEKIHLKGMDQLLQKGKKHE